MDDHKAATGNPRGAPTGQPPLPLPGRGEHGSAMVRITIAGTTRSWWAALHEARDAGQLPPALEPIASGADGEVTLPVSEWQSARGWCASLPGWVEGDGIEQLIAEDIADE